MLEYWDDTAAMVDEKWSHIFQVKVPQTQQLIADALNVSKKERIVFAPNTHELLYRIYSSFDKKTPIKILTTDSEFYSFQRQLERWQQSGEVEATIVPTEPFDSFEQRFIEQANAAEYDWIFVSQVFFNSGMAIQSLPEFVRQFPTSPLVTIDGYHGFFAIPTDLSEIEQRIFYLAGSYKYAQGGEGACFVVVPDGEYQPSYTGWFAEFGDLHKREKGQVAYAKDGQQFAGATMDYSAVYRLDAVLSQFKELGVTVDDIHSYVKACQEKFLKHLYSLKHPLLNESNLMQQHLTSGEHGHFLTFKLPENDVQRLAKQLDSAGIKTDFRADRLRFGFALYHDPKQYDLTILRSA
jgi:selenocysteine lyase/cysteine desulfurase